MQNNHMYPHSISTLDDEPGLYQEFDFKLLSNEGEGLLKERNCSSIYQYIEQFTKNKYVLFIFVSNLNTQKTNIFFKDKVKDFKLEENIGFVYGDLSNNKFNSKYLHSVVSSMTFNGEKIVFVPIVFEAYKYLIFPSFYALCCPNKNTFDKLVECFDSIKINVLNKIITYDSGNYQEQSKSSIKNLNWDSLIIKDSIKSEIIKEIQSFTSDEHKQIYSELGIGYHRGMILIGPPGCGKTLTAKIIANHMDLPFVSVKSLNPSNVKGNLQDIYENSYNLSGGRVVLIEDLDSFIHPSDMSFFLNLLDGIGSDYPILTIATTNHYDKIDPALLNRPSRFDRKYIYDLPSESLRLEYLTKKLNILVPGTDDLIKETITSIAKKTNNFSFALLQELIIHTVYNYRTDVNKKHLNDYLNESFDIMQNQTKLGDVDEIYKQIERNNGHAKVGLR